VSVRVQTYVWQLKLTPTQKLVAIALADHCHDDGSEARPSQETICKKTGLGITAVRRTLHQLVDLGVMILDRPSSQHRANCYMFLIPNGFATIRPSREVGLAPDRPLGSQTVPSVRPDRHEGTPNHKEPSLETGQTEIVDLLAIRATNDRIFNRKRT